MAFSKQNTGPRKRVLLAGLFHETNTFAPGHTSLAEFSVQLGREILQRYGDGSPLGAFLEEAERLSWEVVPTIDMRATPGPPPDPEAIGFFFHEFEKLSAPAATEKLDAIFLVLHGAMAIPGLPDVEGEFLARIRNHSHLAQLPIFGVLDLHSNFSPAMADNSQALLAYRENPHIDAADTARRASLLLKRHFDEELGLQTHFVQTSIIWPPTGTATSRDPMRSLESLARQLEKDGIEAVNVFAGFAHADTPFTGVSFSIVYNPKLVPPERLAGISNALRQAALVNKERGFPVEWDLDTAIDDAQSKDIYPVCLVEPSDNIGGGSPGNGTCILRMLLHKKITGSGIIINDPAAVLLLKDKMPGSTHTLQIHGMGFPLDPDSITVKAKLLRLTDGAFTLEDPQSHLASLSGLRVDMGPCAVVECEGTTLLLTSRRTPPFDLGQWRSQGVAPEKLRFIGIKAAVAHRRAYDPITKASYTVRTPGPCTSNLCSLPYKHVRRPIFPLDS